MESTTFDIEQREHRKLHRVDDPRTGQSYYIQVHSENFICDVYDKGTCIERAKYNMPPYLTKYWAKRKFLFSRFSEGIKLDNQSWFSAIPEKVSLYLRKRFQSSGFTKVFEPFCGVGGIAVHLCDAFDEYVVNDIDKTKIKMLKGNLKVYGKDLSCVQPYRQDFLQVKPFSTEMLIVCPPWGGIDISEYSYADLDEIMQPKLTDILKHCTNFSSNILLQMPKNTNIMNLIKVINRCAIYPVFSIEKILTNGKTSQLFIYFGDSNFTGITDYDVLGCLYKDLSVEERNDRNFVKKNMKETPNKVMQEVFSLHGSSGGKNRSADK